MYRLLKKLQTFFKGENAEDGQAIVEFALALPVLLLLLCGILDFGWIYANQYSVQYASYSGARYASLYAGSSTDSTALVSSVTERAKENLIGSGNGASVSVAVGTDSVTVTVSYPIKTLTFVASTLFGDYYTSTSTSVASY